MKKILKIHLLIMLLLNFLLLQDCFSYVSSDDDIITIIYAEEDNGNGN